jgi:hypothetical protein
MEAPWQKIVWEILPAIKAAIAAELIRHQVSQAEASRMLAMAPSAISQYLSGKRGYRIEFSGAVKASVAALAQDIIDNKEPDLVKRTCAICRQIRGEDESDSMSCTCCGS